jgi:hypothetical protein
VSIATTKPILWEVADIVEQIFTIALVEDLTPTPEDRYAAIGHQADHGLSVPQMRERLRCCYGTMREVDERARQVRLMRLYASRWRVWDSAERPRFRRRPNVNAQPRRAKKRAALVGSEIGEAR